MSSVPDDFDRGQLKNRKWKGEDIKMNESIARSPTEKSRRCTDILCCILFAAFCVGMLASSINGYVNGNPWKLVAPIDGDNNICGYSPGYEGYDKLYINDIADAVDNPANIFKYGVCVRSCPGDASDSIECKKTGTVTACQPLPGQGYSTHEVLNYCYPNYDSLPQEAKDNWTAVTSAINDTSLGGIFADLYEIRWVLLIAAGIAFVATLIYIKFMDWCAFWLAWISVFLILGSLVGTGVWAYMYRQDQIE